MHVRSHSRIDIRNSVFHTETNHSFFIPKKISDFWNLHFFIFNQCLSGGCSKMSPFPWRLLVFTILLAIFQLQKNMKMRFSEFADFFGYKKLFDWSLYEIPNSCYQFYYVNERAQKTLHTLFWFWTLFDPRSMPFHGSGRRKSSIFLDLLPTLGGSFSELRRS